MASIKVVLIKSKSNDLGQSPVNIQINHDYKTARITLFWIEPKYFVNGKVSRSHKEFVKLNNVINRELAKYEERVYELEQIGEPYTAYDVRDKESVKTQLLTDVLDAYKKRLESLNKRSRIYQNIIDRVKEFD